MHPQSPLPPAPAAASYLFQRLERIRDRLATEHLPPLLDTLCQTWYVQLVTMYLAQHLRALYRRRVLQVVQEQGHDALPHHHAPG